jgi:hypothetical protein
VFILTETFRISDLVGVDYKYLIAADNIFFELHFIRQTGIWKTIIFFSGFLDSNTKIKNFLMPGKGNVYVNKNLILFESTGCILPFQESILKKK